MGIIESDKFHNFKKYNSFEIDSRGEHYDYYSIMHYGPMFFSKNGLVTIEPTKNKFMLEVIGRATEVCTDVTCVFMCVCAI